MTKQKLVRAVKNIITPRECDTCGRSCEYDEKICIRCEDIQYDAWLDSQSEVASYESIHD